MASLILFTLVDQAGKVYHLTRHITRTYCTNYLIDQVEIYSASIQAEFPGQAKRNSRVKQNI